MLTIRRKFLIMAASAATVLSLTLTGCGSEVEGTNSDTLASVTTPTTPTSDPAEETILSSTQLVNAHRKPLRVLEDLGLGTDLGLPDDTLTRCSVRMQKSLPRAKAAAILTSTTKSLLIKIVMAGQLHPNQLSLFTFSTHHAANQRSVGIHHGMVTRNSVIINQPLKGATKVKEMLRGYVSMEPSEDGFILWMEIPRDYAGAFNSTDWAVSITLGKKKINGCGA